MKKIIISILSVLLGSFVFAVPAYADSVSVNFENPPYTLGTINAQDGWSSLGAAGSGCAIYDHAVDSSLGTTGFGSQSLRISNAVVSGCFGDQTFAKPLTDAVGETSATAGTYSVGTKQKHFEMKFDIASAVPSALQPGLYMSVSPDRGDGSRMSYLRFEDQLDGIHVFFDDVTDAGPLGTVATFNETDIATVSRAPHTIKLTLDTLDGQSNDVVHVWIDGVLKATGTSWEDYYRFDPEASAEQSPRIVKSVLFRTGGTQDVDNAAGTAGKGFLVDNFSLLSGAIPPVLVGPPTNKDQCKDNGWKTFNNPSFKNQGQCVDYVNDHAHDHDHDRDHGRNGDGGHGDKDERHGRKSDHFAFGDIRMSSPSQKMIFMIQDKGLSANDKGKVDYWNYDYPNLHYKANILCANVKTSTKEAWFMFQIPAGWPGLTGLYVVSYVKDVGTPGTHGDLYGHTASGDLTTAISWCENGTAPVGMYPITGGNVVVEAH